MNKQWNKDEISQSIVSNVEPDESPSGGNTAEDSPYASALALRRRCRHPRPLDPQKAVDY